MVRYLHLFNRGVDKRVIFVDDSDRRRFVQAVRLSRLSNSPRLSWINRLIRTGNTSPKEIEKIEKKYGPPLVKIIAYALMPNHFHFQVKELEENGVSQFFRRLGTSFVMYFNIKHERTGRLFESKYKSVVIESDEQLVHLSRYIHTNPANSSKININLNELKKYSWTSLPDYLGIREQPFCEPSEVMTFFKSPKDYWQFLKGIIKSEEPMSSKLLLDSNTQD